MWEKYKGKGVVIIGIHTPEFEFEKKISNVKEAVKRHRIEYPVLSDPERTNWENYGNTYWPRAALIDLNGSVIMEHIGESGYDEIDDAISSELERMGVRVFKMPLAPKKRHITVGISPETYAGSARNIGLGSSKVCTKMRCGFHDPGNHAMNTVYPDGAWNQKPEFIEQKGEGRISFRFFASEVNAVMSGKGLAEVKIDGRYLTKAEAGVDIIFEKRRSLVRIERPDIYNLMRMKHFREGDIEISGFPGLRIYAYTFG
jgi:hypothetical protein